MGKVELTKLSSKGQIVIPQDIRDELQADEGTVFAVVGSKDTIVLKKVETPSKEKLIRELEAIAKESRKKLESKGIKESDFVEIVHKSRGK